MTSQIHCRAAVESNPPYPPPPAVPPTKRSTISLVVSLVLIGLLPVGAPGLALWSGRDAIGRAQAGDCLRYTDELDRPYRVINCADPSAGFTLLATKPTAKECIDVPGVSRTVTDDKRSYCIGKKGVDVSKAINGIKAGECLIFDGYRPSKADCRKGSVPVLLVLEDVDKIADPDLGSLAWPTSRCVGRGAKDVRQTYAWGISAGRESKTIGTWDRLLCLGPPNQ